jgi:predicted flap endonuclease-1-like 5' DNA nuclease
MAKLIDIEGIGEVYAAKLSAIGITSQEDLLAKGAKPEGRKKIATESGISDTLILKWVNRADLARIKGVAEEYADLLEVSGVDTVPELAQRVPAHLHAKLVEVNAAKNLVRSLPSESAVVTWVAEAKTLPRAIFY